MDFAWFSSCSMCHVFRAEGHAPVDHLLGQRLAEGPVHALQDLADLPVLASIGKGVVGLAPGGIDVVVPLHGADGPVPVAAVVPDMIVGVHAYNCTHTALNVNVANQHPEGAAGPVLS